MTRRFKIIAVFASLLFMQAACRRDAAEQEMMAKADSLLINVRCITTVTGLINNNFLLPGQKRTQYKIEYIQETWPDTITPVQAGKLITLKELTQGFDHLLAISKGLQTRSVQQLEQLKKLNQTIISGALSSENTLQYLNFESKCADTLNRVLDTLVKRSIDLSCRSQSL